MELSEQALGLFTNTTKLLLFVEGNRHPLVPRHRCGTKLEEAVMRGLMKSNRPPKPEPRAPRTVRWIHCCPHPFGLALEVGVLLALEIQASTYLSEEREVTYRYPSSTLLLTRGSGS